MPFAFRRHHLRPCPSTSTPPSARPSACSPGCAGWRRARRSSRRCAPGSRHQREKLAVLSAFAPQALLKAPGFDAAPALHALAAHAAAEHPQRFGVGRPARPCARAGRRGGRRRGRTGRRRRLRPRRRDRRAACAGCRRVAPGRPAEPGLRRGLRGRRRRHRPHSLAGRGPAVALGARGEGRPPLRRGACAGGRQRLVVGARRR